MDNAAKKQRFATFAWAVLAYNLAVVLFGAVVRATGSGAGCRNHWPLCDGQVVPDFNSIHRIIEFSHRASVGVAVVLIVWLAVLAFRLFPREHPVRTGILLSLFFTFTESLIGAVLVKFGFVDKDTSVGRAIVMSAHLVNTFLLVASLTLTAWWASGGSPPRLSGQGAVGLMIGLAIFGTLALGVTGAVTALGDTLYPAKSLAEGLRQDLSPTAHFLIRLRILHPLIAMSVGLYLLLVAGLLSHLRPSLNTKRFAYWTGVLFLSQVALGAMNWLLLVPLATQLAHLLLADAVWIVLVLMSASALAVDVPHAELSMPHTRPEAVEPATWRTYLSLTKPHVVSLLLFTALAAMFIAKRGWPGWGLFLAVAFGGYMAAGAGHVINMVIDKDIDGRMKRTARRPIVTEQISPQNALFFAFSMAVTSFLLLWIATNLLAAMLSLAGMVFYVLIYTMVLKRRTSQNIVIGGAAGAFPPLVGWAAVTGDLSPLAWYLFAIIFVWTPVHFWALALMIKDDYAEAGVPMLPVVRGVRTTVAQIGVYAVITTVISVLPLLQGQVHGVYLGAIVLLNGLLLLRCAQLYRNPDRPRAVSLFKYSMLYLALLFLTMAVDRAFLGDAVVRAAPDRAHIVSNSAREV
jgi:heme o synthase